jgi:uncharacterized protein YdeI (YjbR/CyaY-like superfamily)
MAKRSKRTHLHSLPKDLNTALKTNKLLLTTWQTLTPLAKNEWICWLTYVKKPLTRQQHLSRLTNDLKQGKRRPCCWPGCPHRNSNAKKYF